MIVCVCRTEGNRTMTVKTLLTFTMIVTAVFVFKDVPTKTLIDIMIAVIAVALYWLPKEKD